MLERFCFLVPLLPLLAGLFILVSTFFGRTLSERTTSRIAMLSALLSFLGAGGLVLRAIFSPAPLSAFFLRWLESGSYSVPFELYVDSLSTSLALLVSGVGLFVLRFATTYMHREAGFSRFFGILCVFLSAMLLLVLGGNLVMTFVGWEGAGLTSYLLIGYHYERKAPARAGTYAFVMNRIGDAAFLAGIFIAFDKLGTIRYWQIFDAARAADHASVTAIGLCLLVAAAAKSAQLPFSPWISRAMEGPTPSSALFYGSIMVTGGVYLVLRMHPVYTIAPDALRVMATMGALTALYGGLVSLVQTDVKSGLIFSTTSQLGLMFLAVGLGARDIALFHLFAHSLLRAAQFLSAPSTLLMVTRDEHSPSERPLAAEIDPAFWLLLVGLLGILAVPFMAEIWAGADSPFSPGAFLAAAGAGMALFCGGHYLARFANRFLSKVEGGAEIKTITRIVEHGPLWIAPAVVTVVVVSLGLASGTDSHGILNLFVDPLLSERALGRSAHPFWSFFVLVVLGALLVAGWAAALYFHRAAPERPGILPTRLRGLYVTALGRFWLEPLYERFFIRPIRRLGQTLDRLDATLLDRAFGRPLSPEDAPAPLAAFQERVLAGEIDDADPFAAVRAALDRPSLASAEVEEADDALKEDDFARGRGLLGRSVQIASTLAHLLEKHVVGRAIGRGIPVTGDMLGRALNHIEALLENPIVVGLLVVASLFIAVRWVI